jgi:GTP-binding protein
MLKDAPDDSGVRQTDALNLQKKVKSRTDSANLGDYTITADLATERAWYVHGRALERFAQMTDWNFFEASLRFQRVLRRVGLWADLEKRGVQEGDTVVIGESAFSWSSDQSERKVFEAWKSAVGVRKRGTARWPHASV